MSMRNVLCWNLGILFVGIMAAVASDDFIRVLSNG